MEITICSVSSSSVLVVVSVLVQILLCLGQDQKLASNGFISWDDLRVDEVMITEQNSTEAMIRTRVIVVDKNGTGNSVTVQGAIDMVPFNNINRVKILILPGIYREKVVVPSSKPYISFIGMENQTSETVITWNNKASDKDGNGCQLGTYRSASVTIESDYFCATGVTFETVRFCIQNTVVAVPGGYGMQAVALRISGDKAMFYRVRVLGTQDTLLDETGNHYFYQCHIQGSVDFIFGRSKSLYEECILQSTAPRTGAIAAHHRDSPDEDTGFSFVNCVVKGTGSVLLGRAWGNFSTTIYSYCFFDNIINPIGWSDWNRPYRQRTVVFGEYQCRGEGAEMEGRVPWSRSLSYSEAKPFLERSFIRGDEWLRL